MRKLKKLVLSGVNLGRVLERTWAAVVQQRRPLAVVLRSCRLFAVAAVQQQRKLAAAAASEPLRTEVELARTTDHLGQRRLAEPVSPSTVM